MVGYSSDKSPLMNRETTNIIRYVIEEVLPPALRDSKIFFWLSTLIYGKHMKDLYYFRLNSWNLSQEQYENLYNEHPRIHALTDNSSKCIQAILHHLSGKTVLDVGCGSGYLLSLIRKSNPELSCRGFDITSVNLIADDLQKLDVDFGDLSHLPYPDSSFDTVVCTHVLEHVLSIQQCISELRRVTKRKLIIVVPKERESLYAFNPHLHFFPYKHSLLRVLMPVPGSFALNQIGRDFFYVENL